MRRGETSGAWLRVKTECRRGHQKAFVALKDVGPVNERKLRRIQRRGAAGVS